MGAARALRGGGRRARHLRVRVVAAGAPVAGGRTGSARRSHPAADRARGQARPRAGTRALPGVPRDHARHHVLGLPRALHRHRAGDDRLRHHPAPLRLQAAQGHVLPRVRDRARPLRALLRDRAGDGGVAAVRATAGPPRPHGTLRRRARAALRDQRDGLSHGGVPPGGRAAVVGAVVAGGLEPRTRAARGRAGRGRRCAGPTSGSGSSTP